METSKYITVRGIIITGWVMMLLCIATILGANIYLMVSGQPVPEMLANWGATALGFLIAHFAPLVKDFIGKTE